MRPRRRRPRLDQEPGGFGSAAGDRVVERGAKGVLLAQVGSRGDKLLNLLEVALFGRVVEWPGGRDEGAGEKGRGHERGRE